MAGEAMPTVEPLTYAGLVLGALLLGGVALFVPARVLMRRRPADEMASGQ
jgi:ABC-type antimicrobial peptide transport system permease subunit